MLRMHPIALSVLVILSGLAGCGSPAPGPVDSGGGESDSGPLADAQVAPDAPSTDDAGPATADAASPGDGGAAATAYVSDSCGPADGPAIQLLIFDAPGAAACTADDSMRTLSFYVHDLGGAVVPPRSGDTITSTMASSSGTASECPGGTPPCRLSETWTLTFDGYVDGGDASGRFSVTWADGTTTSGQFDATRCETGVPTRCG